MAMRLFHIGRPFIIWGEIESPFLIISMCGNTRQSTNIIYLLHTKLKKMEKKFEVLPPTMPNYVRFKKSAGLRQEGIKIEEGFPISQFTREEAEEYGELMKQTLAGHKDLERHL